MPLFLFAAVVLAAAEPAATDTAVTQAAAPPAAVSTVTVKPKTKSDRVCWDEKPTGSHMPTRVCVSREEFDQRQRADQQAVASGRRVGAKGAFGPN